MSAGHRSVEHTADLAVELWAPDLPGLLREGALAVTEILTDGATISGTDVREIDVDGIDDEDRLVRFLNEVLWLASGTGFLVADAEVAVTAGIHARLLGQADAADRLRTEIKSATFHQLAIVHDDAGVRTRVVLDV